MTEQDYRDHGDDPRCGQVRTAGLRVAALTGAVLAAGAITVGGGIDGAEEPIETVVSGSTALGLGTTCCTEGE